MSDRERNETSAEVWLEYERRKLEIARTARSAEEYERRLAELAKELGL